MSKSKQSKKSKQSYVKNSQKDCNASSDNQKVVWVFDQPDSDGQFAFRLDLIETRSDLHNIFDKMMQYETMTWAEIKQQTHDRGKSKHHFLDMDGMSPEAKERIEKLHLEESSDSVFSFALTNLLRIVGIRDGQFFYVKWYDPEHRFYPST